MLATGDVVGDPPVSARVPARLVVTAE